MHQWKEQGTSWEVECGILASDSAGSNQFVQAKFLVMWFFCNEIIRYFSKSWTSLHHTHSPPPLERFDISVQGKHKKEYYQLLRLEEKKPLKCTQFSKNGQQRALFLYVIIKMQIYAKLASFMIVNVYISNLNAITCNTKLNRFHAHAWYDMPRKSFSEHIFTIRPMV